MQRYEKKFVPLHSNSNFLIFNKKDVTLNFQKSIAKSQATFPIVGTIALVAWMLPPLPSPWLHLPTIQPNGFVSRLSSADDGLWQHLPPFLQQGLWSQALSFLCASIAVYLMAELNNKNVLLRESSRILSSMLAFLLALIIPCHSFQPGMVAMPLIVYSFFPLFATYQQPSPVLTLSSYLCLSVVSLIFPKFVWMTPLYWIIQMLFRALTFRCFAASLLGIALPYWFYGGIAVMTDSLKDFLAHFEAMGNFHWFDYSPLNLRDATVFLFIATLFLVGTIDFYIHQFFDKTRVRIIYKSLILLGIASALIIVSLPQYLWTFLPLLIVCTAALFGHFFALTRTKFSHILCLILLLLGLGVLIVQYI